MTFTDTDIKGLWELFALPRTELHDGSAFRQCLTQTEADDVTYSTTVVDDVRLLLSEISTLETTIATDAAETKYKRVDVFQDYEVDYGDSDPANYSRGQREIKKQRIRNLIELDRYVSQSNQYARVIGINDVTGLYYR